MTIRRGSRGSEVKSFQTFLISEGVLDDRADGIAGPKTVAAIKAFQVREGLSADGIAGRNTFAAARKLGWKTQAPQSSSSSSGDVAVAEKAGIPVDVLRAFRATESGGRADAIRFEPHLFLRKRPDLEGQIPFTPGPKHFSVTRSETNKSAFDRAFSLDAEVAVRSTSWGLYQVLGGYLLKAYGDPQTAVDNFYSAPETASDMTVAAWFADNPRAVKAANDKDWRELARRYNGSGNVDRYSAKLESNYQKVISAVG